MKKIFIYSLSALLFVGLVAFQTPKKAKKAKKASKTEQKEEPKVAAKKAYDVSFDKTFHDFGTATEGDQVETTYKLTNNGTEPVLILSHEIQCGCTTPTYTKEPIMPGSTVDIKVGFNTHGKVGVNEKTVTLKTNGDSHVLKFKCEVKQKTVVDPIKPGNQIKLDKKN